MLTVTICTLTGDPDPSIAIAGSRAGALGILDLSSCRQEAKARSLLERLARHGGKLLGFRVTCAAFHALAPLWPTLPARFSHVLVVPDAPAGLADVVSSLRENGLTVLLECTSAIEAEAGERSGADMLVAKGNESGGRVGEETAFILFQRLISSSSLPVLAQGGIGPATAAACVAGGAAGVVLDAQLLLARESLLSPELRDFLSRRDGRDSILLGEEGEWRRVLAYPAGKRAEPLTAAEVDSLLEAGSLLPIGQDVALARPLADRFVTVGGIVGAVEESVRLSLRQAADGNVFAEGGAMAQSHATRFALVQGPMARVSDSPEFADAVARQGGLPFLAAAWLRAAELEPLLAATSKRLAGQPWGVGLLGFLPSEVYAEQLNVLRSRRPPFALIAGGRPHQVKELEAEGIATYVHVPTVALLELFLEAGCRRFIFEGREAGGHVGPLCGFVLWEAMLERLLAHAEKTGGLRGIHLLFAGGLKDARSAAMIAALTAPLAAKGAAVGLQVGSAYLFTEEAVSTGAIVPRYQRELLACCRTTLLESGPGHAVRCVTTPFTARFQEEKRRLAARQIPLDEAGKILARLERGRLRLAAKGVGRPQGNEDTKLGLENISEETQHAEGEYMIGQMAALQGSTRTIADLHHDLAVGGFGLIRERTAVLTAAKPARRRPQPSDVAIIGMAGFFPRAADVPGYWSNILNKVNTIREIPAERWDCAPFFDPDRTARDRIYARWGSFLDPVPFDPLRYGMPPKMIPSVEPLHLLSLEAVRMALIDAGYERRPFDRERTAVTMGISGSGDLAQLYGFRTMLPMFFGQGADEIVEHFKEVLPEWTEDSFPGILMNVAAGRIANRFDFGGMNTLVDGACASSLAALYVAVNELETGACDLAVAGGADCMQSPFTYMCFSKTHALSPRGVCNCLDARADGIVIGESIVTVVLKRLADAERDGDRIYAVIKAMGASSDGRDRSLTAPGIAGQMRALERAYDKAGVPLSSVRLIEAHATGTVEGDRVELESLCRAMKKAGSPVRGCAVGSVKSMIGHSKSAAGLASLVKTALALHRRVLPPTLHVETPNPGLQKDDCPLYANTEARPWLSADHPRRAGLNAFGFGGTNYHAVLEEYGGGYYPEPRPAPYQALATELFRWRAENRAALAAKLTAFRALAESYRQAPLGSLALRNDLDEKRSAAETAGPARLALVASSTDDLFAKLDSAATFLAGTAATLADPRGLFYNGEPLAGARDIAFLFPGQGSQYVDMLAELCIQFPELHEIFERSDRLLRDRLGSPLSSAIFPATAFTEEERGKQARDLARTTFAQPAMGSADLAMLRLWKRLGVSPAMTAGHSYGEYVALAAAEVVGEEELITLSEARARFILQGVGKDPGAMAAVEATVERVEEELAGRAGVWIANVNAPDQVVITGESGAVERTVAELDRKNIKARKIPVSCAFHSPLVEPACGKLAAYLDGLEIRPPRLPVFSNTTAGPYPAEPVAIRQNLARHLVERVRFVEQIERMYEAGARIFVECGPGRVLSGLVAKILAGRPHLAVVSNQRGRSAFSQLQFALAELFSHGVDADLAPLFHGRHLPTLEETEKSLPATTWLVTGSRSVPLAAADKTPMVAPFPLAAAAAGRAPAGQQAAATTSGRGAAANAPLAAESSQAAMAGFQNLMQQFLATQEAVMNRYFLGKRQVAPAPPAVAGEAKETPDEAPARDEETAPLPAPHPAAEPRAELLAVVCERTGYPAEMIDFDGDLEADLGIDSIKRVEILGAFLKIPAIAPFAEAARAAAEKSRTLNQILAALAQAGPAAGEQSEQVAVPSEPAVEPPAAAGPAEVGRCLVELEELEAVDCRPLPANCGVVLTDDGHGVAEDLAHRFAASGHGVVLLKKQPAADPAGPWSELALDGDTATLADEARRRLGRIGGFVHLAPMASSPAGEELSAGRWHLRLVTELKPLFELLQAFGPDLRETGGIAGAAWQGDGRFGLGADRALPFFAGHGALAGFLKTIALEWPEVRVKAVDIAHNTDPTTTGAILFEELLAGDSRVETGRAGGQRFGKTCRVAPLATGNGGPPALEPGSDWVVVVTGGARGITARVCRELALRHRPTLVLVGRSPLPDEEEDEVSRHLESEAQVKQWLIAEARKESRTPSIAETDKSCRQIFAAREIRTALRALREAGSRVEYHSLDVADAEVFAAFLRRVRTGHGRLDGIIHGAGIIEDKLFLDKEWASFARVFFTKADSAWVLGSVLEELDPRFVAFFSSVAGSFGNRGQADYAAANEVMNRLALQLAGKGNCRLMALNWGPWAGSGMASAEVQKQFAERGVVPIDQAAGATAFVRELCFGAADEVEILLGNGPWLALGKKAPALPLFPENAPEASENGAFSLQILLDPGRHLYLGDHLLDGKPVLPAAMAAEIMAEAARRLAPGAGQTMAVRDLRVLKGIVVEGEPQKILVTARPAAPSATGGRLFELELAGADRRLYYRGRVELAAPAVKTLPAPPPLSGLQPLGKSPAELYGNWLFHGPLFQCLTGIEGISEHGMRATLRPSAARRCLAESPAGADWLIDPVAVDGGLQLALIWARWRAGITVLPSAVKAVHRFRPFSEATELLCQLEVVATLSPQSFLFNMYFSDRLGTLYGMIEEVEATGSRALNRLAGKADNGQGREVAA